MNRNKKTKKEHPLRIAGYVRVSSQRQVNEGESLGVQQKEIEQEVEYRKRRDDWDVASLEFFVDKGRSAKDQKRPELQRLKRAVAAGRIDRVICFKLDRITRSMNDFVDLWRHFRHYEVDVVSLREKFDTSIPAGKAMLQIIMVFAELERDMTAERTYAIMKDRVARGLWNGGHVLGYRSNKDESGQLEVVEDEAALVHLIFDSYEELGSAGAVTRRLSDQGIRYPSYQTRSGKQRGGNLFQKQKVTRILSNPIYIGRIRWGEEEYDGVHEPIISNEQFERVQNQLGQTRKRRMNLRKPKGRCYLLSGLLRCSCGAHMSGYSTSGRSRTHYYYRCSIQNHEGGQYSCSSPRVPAEALEEAVILRIRELGNALEAREEIVERAVTCLDSEAAKLDEESAILLRQQTRTKADIRQLLEVLKSQGAKALKSIQDELNRLEREDVEIQNRLTEIEQRREPMQRISEDAKSFVRTWEDVGELLEAATNEERQQLLHHYVEVIELHAYDKKGKKGTYAMRMFPEVRPDRDFEWQEVVPIIGSIDTSSEPQKNGAETKNGAADEDDDNSDSLSDSDPVCITDQKAPRDEPSSKLFSVFSMFENTGFWTVCEKYSVCNVAISLLPASTYDSSSKYDSTSSDEVNAGFRRPKYSFEFFDPTGVTSSGRRAGTRAQNSRML